MGLTIQLMYKIVRDDMTTRLHAPWQRTVGSEEKEVVTWHGESSLVSSPGLQMINNLQSSADHKSMGILSPPSPSPTDYSSSAVPTRRSCECSTLRGSSFRVWASCRVSLMWGTR